jgi:hypothetical protein
LAGEVGRLLEEVVVGYCKALSEYLRSGTTKGIEFLATDPEARVRFPALPKKVGLERSPLSLVSATEELLDRKVAVPV